MKHDSHPPGAYQLGANGFLVKPSEAGKLQATETMNPKTKILQVGHRQALPSKTSRPMRANGLAAAEKLYLAEIGKAKPLTPRAEMVLAARIRKGDQQARQQMLKANLRLVAKIAPAYEGLGLPLLDLLSEGNLGLLKAVERFDPAKGGTLSSYGSRWIKLSMQRALASQT